MKDTWKSCKKFGYGFSNNSTISYDDHLVKPAKNDPSITHCEEKAKDKARRDGLFGSVLSQVNRSLYRKNGGK